MNTTFQSIPVCIKKQDFSALPFFSRYLYPAHKPSTQESTMHAADLLASVSNVLRATADHSKRLYVGNNTGASLSISDSCATDTLSMTLPLPTYEKDGEFDFDYTTADLMADIECNGITFWCLEAAMVALASGDADACAHAEAVMRGELEEIAESIVHKFVE